MKRLSLTALTALLLVGCATDPSEPGARLETGEIASSISAIPAFEPNPTGTARKIDYEVIDEFLQTAVISLGPSTRKLARPAQNPINTRVKIGHQSRLRLEGSKIPFSQFDRGERELAREYADSLIAIGNQVDITALPRNQQLAYWFNLHNMLVIAELAERYPVREPSKIKIDGVPFHDAKMATINGQDLSLRDIRVGIVYSYWDDPRVIYGFWHGDLAGPSIATNAWDARYIGADLGRNAKEFINSLRGVTKIGKETLLVSPIYDEARDTLFTEWPGDFRKHLLDYADGEVVDLIEERSVIDYSPYEARIADLAGGQPYESISEVQSPFEDPRLANLPLSVQTMIFDVQQKFQSKEFRDRRRARVTIFDPSDLEEGGEDDLQ